MPIKWNSIGPSIVKNSSQISWWWWGRGRKSSETNFFETAKFIWQLDNYNNNISLCQNDYYKKQTKLRSDVRLDILLLR